MTRRVDAGGLGAAVPTLWDRTREMASREILRTALRLFTEQGYDETTIAQIARESGVSQRTLFRYFGSKEDLVGVGEERFAAVLTDAVRAQPEEASPWAALRAGFRAALALHESEDEARVRFRLVLGTDSLRAAYLGKRVRFQEALLPLITARVATAGTPGAGDGARGTETAGTSEAWGAAAAVNASGGGDASGAASASSTAGSAETAFDAPRAAARAILAAAFGCFDAAVATWLEEGTNAGDAETGAEVPAGGGQGPAGVLARYDQAVALVRGGRAPASGS
ncbi:MULTISPECIES: TetR/AcrR family transcriptional regulator [unclassified Streptomyces]|uniref:TetR/AcrR family transcriptional regulator n=1 Tax=unclassified Streptomyces TaxID=2593676 RepID=UPI00081D744A|nr:MULTISPECIES: TetR/AcrR family transcriptional regulator [unclassified Streptomyces]MYR27718.1 TetR family transcriptional regulator [Streptomyces sp. SID4945]SCE06896.1 transcriptional regulator, TetR family [Streptomyces sp. TverLS-915]SCF28209.1 transcriptional regulator, TetR family [Streptomyces sp. LcepLS]